MRIPSSLFMLLLALTHLSSATTYQTIDDAIAHGDLADVRLHLAADPASLNQGRDKTRTPLAQAVQRNKSEIALVLLEAGAKPDAQDGSQRSILHLAVERNNPAMLTALLKAGAKPDARDKDGWTPLHHAAAKNQLASAKALLAGGANPMVLSELGGTPCMKPLPAAAQKSSNSCSITRWIPNSNPNKTSPPWISPKNSKTKRPSPYYQNCEGGTGASRCAHSGFSSGPHHNHHLCCNI